eukprot:gene7810-12283_t
MSTKSSHPNSSKNVLNSVMLLHHQKYNLQRYSVTVDCQFLEELNSGPMEISLIKRIKFTDKTRIRKYKSFSTFDSDSYPRKEKERRKEEFLIFREETSAKMDILIHKFETLETKIDHVQLEIQSELKKIEKYQNSWIKSLSSGVFAIILILLYYDYFNASRSIFKEETNKN